MFKKIFFAILLLTMVSNLYAEDIIITNDAKSIKAKIEEVSKTEVKYKDATNLNGPTFVLEANEIQTIIYENGQVQNFTQSAQTHNASSTSNSASVQDNQPSVDRFPIIPLEATHNDPLAIGNCVYIPTNSPHAYERKGQEYIKEHFYELYEQYAPGETPYVVVDRPEQAHFILHYVVNTMMTDIALLIVRPREYFEAEPYCDQIQRTFKNSGCTMINLVPKGGNLEDPAFNTSTASYCFMYFVAHIVNRDGWKGFWKRYKKKGIFQSMYHGIDPVQVIF